MDRTPKPLSHTTWDLNHCPRSQLTRHPAHTQDLKSGTENEHLTTIFKKKIKKNKPFEMK